MTQNNGFKLSEAVSYAMGEGRGQSRVSCYCTLIIMVEYAKMIIDVCTFHGWVIFMGV